MLRHSLLLTVADPDSNLGDGWHCRLTVSASPQTGNTTTHLSPGVWQGGLSHNADSRSQAMFPNSRQHLSHPTLYPIHVHSLYSVLAGWLHHGTLQRWTRVSRSHQMRGGAALKSSDPGSPCSGRVGPREKAHPRSPDLPITFCC